MQTETLHQSRKRGSRDKWKTTGYPKVLRLDMEYRKIIVDKP